MHETYEIHASYTLDYISWTCPKCNHEVEKMGADLYDLNCPNCGFEREETYIADTEDNTTYGTVWEEENDEDECEEDDNEM